MNLDAHWEKVGKYPHHGICVHISSLRTKRGAGIGEYLDLLLLIDWCKKIGFDLIQILPINDSGFDPSPYNAESSIALDPIYLSLNEMGIKVSGFEELNAPPHVLRSEVLIKKLSLLRSHFKITQEIIQFFKKEESWLRPYATFKELKSTFSQNHWNDWPKTHPEIAEEKLLFHAFLQFHAFRQMKRVHAYAQKHGVRIMGDLPILLNPNSADVWSQPHLFDLTFSAGAPPDFYNSLGQDWGFPLINRKAMKQNGFRWWKQRLKVAENFFDIYRIDHVVGLFRIWGIEKGKLPIEGAYYPKNKATWTKNGKELLEMMMSSTSMLPIAEDLGTVSQGIKNALKKMKISGTHLILQMRERSGKGKYIPFYKYRKESISTISTHDSPPFDLWWIQYPEEAHLFSKFIKIPYTPLIEKEAKKKVLEKAHETPSYFHINLLQEYLSLFPELSWLSPQDERINIPGTILPTNWTYRYRPSLESLTAHPKLSDFIKNLIAKKDASY